MHEKEKLFLKWLHEHRKDMHINLSTVGGLRAAFFGGLEAVEHSLHPTSETLPDQEALSTPEHSATSQSES